MQDDVTFFSLNWISARQNHMAASTVENVGSLKWKAPAVEAEAVESASAGMAKVRESNFGITNVTSCFKEEKVFSKKRRVLNCLIYFNTDNNKNRDENGQEAPRLNRGIKCISQ